MTWSFLLVSVLPQEITNLRYLSELNLFFANMGVREEWIIA